MIVLLQYVILIPHRTNASAPHAFRTARARADVSPDDGDDVSISQEPRRCRAGNVAVPWHFRAVCRIDAAVQFFRLLFPLARRG
jgi:hypothetical protein